MDENYEFQDFRNTFFLEKNQANFFETGPEPEPDIETGYPAGTGFSRISGWFLEVNIIITKFHYLFLYLISDLHGNRWKSAELHPKYSGLVRQQYFDVLYFRHK